MRVLIFIVFAIITVSSVKGQQVPVFNSNYENSWLYNPANVGQGETPSASLIYRNQWVGFDGSPVTTVFGLNGKFNEKHAMGFKLSFDEVNIYSNLNAFLSYAYTAQLKEKHLLTFAFSGGVSNNQIDFSKVVSDDEDDEALLTQESGNTSADFELGIQYKFSKLEVGIAAFQLLGNSVELEQQSEFRNSTYQKIRHFSLNLKYDFELGEALHIEPLILARSVQGMNFHADVNVRLRYDDLVWGGVMYRTTGAVAAMAGANLFNTIGVGYSFEYPLSMNISKTGATHEVHMIYKFRRQAPIAGQAKRNKKKKKEVEKLKSQNAEQYEQIDQLNQQIEVLSREVSALRNKSSENDSIQILQEQKMQDLLQKEIERLKIKEGLNDSNTEEIQQDFEETKEQQTEDRKLREEKREEDIEELEAYLNSLKNQKPVSGKDQYLVLGSYYKESQALAYQKQVMSKLNLSSLVVSSADDSYFYVCSSQVNNLKLAVSEVEKNYKGYDINGRPWVFLKVKE
ncbi:MAG: PorP/SprF family type IX secretion system membrane protein [Salibacteraceae bacterium]